MMMILLMMVVIMKMIMLKMVMMMISILKKTSFPSPYTPIPGLLLCGSGDFIIIVLIKEKQEAARMACALVLFPPPSCAILWAVHSQN